MTGNISTHSQAFSLNQDINNLAEVYINKHYPGLNYVNIAYLVREHTRYSNSQAVAVKAHKTSDRDFFLHGFHFLLIFDKTVWLEASDEFREALTDQGLWSLHVDLGGDGIPIRDKTGAVRCKVRTPDFLGSPEVAARHGEWSMELREFLSTFKQPTRNKKEESTEEVDEDEVAASTMLASGPIVVEGEGETKSESVELTLPVDLSDSITLEDVNTEPDIGPEADDSFDLHGDMLDVSEDQIDENGKPILDEDFDMITSAVSTKKEEEEDDYSDWEI